MEALNQRQLAVLQCVSERKSRQQIAATVLASIWAVKSTILNLRARGLVELIWDQPSGRCFVQITEDGKKTLREACRCRAIRSSKSK